MIVASLKASRLFILGLCLAVSALGAASAAPSSASQTFVAAAGGADRYEILAGQLIQAQSQNQKVRDFAQMMIEHHSQTRQRLAKAATAVGAPPPPDTLGGDQQRMLGALQSMAGPALDRAYMTQQVNAHVSALATLTAFAAHGDDSDLRDAAQAAVPIVRRHLDQAKALKASLPSD